jgi:hypothetical protein
MNLETIMETVWGILNTPAAITFVAGVVLVILNKIYAAKPGWAKFEGAIISAIKFAEKQVADDTPNKGLAKFDEALKYVIKVYEETTKKKASPKVIADLKEGVQIVHNELDAAGVLRK